MAETIMEWDELNIIRETVPETLSEYRRNRNPETLRKFCDYLEFVLCLVYAYGWKDAEEIVGIVPFKDGLDDKCVNLDIDGETFRDRIQTQFDEDSVDGVLRIIDTEAHRDYNTGVYDAGDESGIEGLSKTWRTRLDDKVRDAHFYLEGVKVGLHDRFYTYTGDSALYPGGFGVPELDINCRCSIELSR